MENVPLEEPRRSWRELPITAIGGIVNEDPESGEGGSGDPFEHAAPGCYSQPETLSYVGTVDWEIIFERAGIPEQYRPSWRSYIDGEGVEDIPSAHYKFILRACNKDPWRSKIRAAIEAQRETDPLFGVPRPKWNNRDERHRTLYRSGWHPVAQASVSTISRAVSVSSTMYWKDGDDPGPVTRSVKHRSVQRFVVGCDGFRENFQGERLEEYGRSVGASLKSLIVP